MSGPAEILVARYRSRAGLALAMARTHQFLGELEPFIRSGTETLAPLADAFRGWRRALRDADDEAALDAAETAWVRIEATRAELFAKDARLQAYRVRWACENAPLRPHTVESLTRFYREMPCTVASQSKYEYFLTRLLSGPIGPDRELASSEELLEALVEREALWGIKPARAPERELQAVVPALAAFVDEASRHADPTRGTASAFLQRFGALKSHLGPNLFDPRIAVPVVEANVAIFNILGHLLADIRAAPIHRTEEIRRPSFAKPVPPPAVPPPAVPEVARPAPGRFDDSASEAFPTPAPVTDSAPATSAEPSPELKRPRPNLDTGEVDLSAFDVRRKKPSDDSAVGLDPDLDTEMEAAGEGVVPSREKSRSDSDSGPDSGAASGPDSGDDAEQPRVESGADDPHIPAKQQPSMRARGLGELPENKAIIERYLREPRSAEVWQLDLDVFLSPLNTGEGVSNELASERRRSLELILASDDLICERVGQEGAATTEFRSRAKAVASAMALLRTSLRRAADGAPPGVLERVLYASDHLLWERLRLEASLKRNPKRIRISLKPRRGTAPAPVTRAAAAAALRRRRIALGSIAASLLLATGLAMAGLVYPVRAVDPDVRILPVAALPGAVYIEDARTLGRSAFITVGPSWSLLTPDARRQHVRALREFVGRYGVEEVSVVDITGEPRASFQNDDVTLASELTTSDLENR